MERTQVWTTLDRRIKWSIAIVMLFVSLMISSCVVKDEIYVDPPDDFQESDLIGTWEAHYDGNGTGIDRLVLREDGTFQQTYDSLEHHTYQTSWNKWYVEYSGGDLVFVYLEGARFYDEGRSVAEADGIGCPAAKCGVGVPYPFRDPVSKEFVEMAGKLVLIVRSPADAPSELVMKHMLLGVDDFRSGEFHLVEEP